MSFKQYRRAYRQEDLHRKPFARRDSTVSICALIVTVALVAVALHLNLINRNSFHGPNKGSPLYVLTHR